MWNKIRHFFGMRKLKSLLALAICFGLWQLMRLIFPALEPHPIYAYIYAIIEMRNSIETQKTTCVSRLKANAVGFTVAFAAIAVSQALMPLSFVREHTVITQVAIILVGVLLSLNIAEKVKCTTLCAIAALTFIICFLHTDTNPYLYAFLRYVQTLMAVGVSFVVNVLICRPKEKN